jgi:hypothetical protein
MVKRAPAFRLRPPLALSENDVERACLDLLRVRGYWAARQHVGAFRTPGGDWVRIGEKGVPDYLVLHGRYRGFLMEVKRQSGGVLSPEQAFKIQQLTLGYRLRVAVVTSSKELADWLQDHEHSP